MDILINLALTRKKLIFKKNNITLYRLLLVLALLIAPILLFLAPLPGFILNGSSPLLVKVITLLFFILIAYIENLTYWKYWSRKELFYLIYSYGEIRSLIKHALGFIRSSIFFFVIAFAAFVKISITIGSIFYILACYSLLLFIFIIFYKIKINTFLCESRKEKRTNLFLWIKLISICITNGIKIRVALIIATILLSMALQSRLIELDILLYYLIIFWGVISFLFNSIRTLINININKNSIFFKSINLNFYKRYKYAMNTMMLFSFLLSIFLNFNILI